MQQLTVPLSALRANPWNPNRMDARHFAAEVESIRTFGFVDPITVREHPDEQGAYQIVDGEHRYRALVHLFDEEDLAPDASLLPYQNEIPVVSLGTIDDATAKRLTLVLNETRGEAPRSDMARLLADIEASVGADEALRGLPLDLHDLDDLLELARIDLPALAAGADRSDAHETAPARTERTDDTEDAGPARAGGFGRDEDPLLHRVLALVDDDDLAVLRAARDAVQQRLGAGEDWPADAAEQWGVVVARLAHAYVNTQGAG